MNGINKKNIFVILAVILVLPALLILPKVSASRHWQAAAEAAGGLPYQIGLTNAIIIPCVTTGIPPVCEGGPLCMTLDVGRCALYSEVSGSPAGGMGQSALFQKMAIAQAGLTPGGQLIAGGMSPVLMDQGVLASAGGCAGCVAKNGFTDKIFNWLDKYIIAGFRNN